MAAAAEVGAKAEVAMVVVGTAEAGRVVVAMVGAREEAGLAGERGGGGGGGGGGGEAGGGGGGGGGGCRRGRSHASASCRLRRGYPGAMSSTRMM